VLVVRETADLVPRLTGDAVSDYQPFTEIPMARREETVLTHHSGSAATQQVSQALAAARRRRRLQLTQIISIVFGGLEILLGLRFILTLIAANPNSGFGLLVYGTTEPLLTPFVGLFGASQAAGMIFEVPTLVAMAVYALLGWWLNAVLRIALARPRVRSIIRSVPLPPLPSAGADDFMGKDEATSRMAKRLRASVERRRAG
jgi:hypothetical protein